MMAFPKWQGKGFAILTDFVIRKRKKKRVFTEQHKQRIREGLKRYHAIGKTTDPRWNATKIIGLTREQIKENMENISKLMYNSKILEHGERTMEVNDDTKTTGAV